jgi:hypothetical protein
LSGDENGKWYDTRGVSERLVSVFLVSKGVTAIGEETRMEVAGGGHDEDEEREKERKVERPRQTESCPI